MLSIRDIALADAAMGLGATERNYTRPFQRLASKIMEDVLIRAGMAIAVGKKVFLAGLTMQFITRPLNSRCLWQQDG